MPHVGRHVFLWFFYENNSTHFFVALAKEDIIGNFVAGKEFDALIVDMDQANAEIDYLVEHTPMEILQKFIYCGDDRNIVKVYVAGKNVKNIL